MMMNRKIYFYGHVQFYVSSFDLRLLSFPSRSTILVELSFVSFNAPNKIWRKIITEIKALIFFFSFFRGAVASFRNDVITFQSLLCVCAPNIVSFSAHSSRFKLSLLYQASGTRFSEWFRKPFLAFVVFVLLCVERRKSLI